MARLFQRIASSETSREASTDLLRLDQAPYLSWVEPWAVAHTIDPSRLPDQPYKRRRIVIASWTLLVGGAEKMAVTTAQLLQPRHDVFLWVASKGNYSVNGDIPVASGDAAELVRFCQGNDIDLVVFNNLALVDANDALQKNGVRTVLLMHGLTADTANLVTGPAGRTDAIWAFDKVCGGLRQFKFMQPLYRLDCPIDLKSLPFKRRKWEAPFQVAFIGRIAPEKNLPNLLRVWQAMHSMLGGAVHFHVVGGPDPADARLGQMRQVELILDELKTSLAGRVFEKQKAITFHGLEKDIPKVLPKFHAVMLSSDFEGQPIALVEALASGALAAFRNIGEVDRLLEGVGILSTPSDRKMGDEEIFQMASEMCDLLRNPKECQRRSLEGRQRVEATHSEPAWSRNVERMIEDILPHELVPEGISADGRAPIVFLPDCPNWSFDVFAKRLHPYFPGSQIHYTNGQVVESRKPPAARVYFHHHWIEMYDSIQRKWYDPTGKHIIVIPDAYWHKQNPREFATVLAFKPTILSLVPNPGVDATYCPYPVPEDFLKVPRYPGLRTNGRLIVGMVSNGYAHAGGDHKGDKLAREIIAGLPWCDLEVAGTDFRLLPDEMPDWYNTIDVFMTLSVSEGCSGAISDAVALGVPIIGTPVGPLDPWCPGQYIQVDRTAQTVIPALERAFQTLGAEKPLPNARPIAAKWTADRIAQIVKRRIGTDD